MRYLVRSLLAIICLCCIGIAIYVPWYFEAHSPLVPYSTFIASVQNGDVKEVLLEGNSIKIYYLNGDIGYSFSPDINNLVPLLLKHAVTIHTQVKKPGIIFYVLLGIIFLCVILLFVAWLFNKHLKKKEESEFVKNKVINLAERVKTITFDDIAGIDEAKEEVREIVEFLRSPTTVSRLGGRIPRGVLLMGPPGTGKTLLAKAIAGEAGVPFFSISGSDFVEMFVGVGASRVRELFGEAKKNAPCIIFIDEIDAVGKNRGMGDAFGGQEERQQTLNALLVEMDGFESGDNVVVLAATNRPDVLDPALLRPGRFDRRIYIPPPDMKGRVAILRVHSRGMAIAPDVELEAIARGIPGFTGADIRNLVNEAALIAARKGNQSITMADFEEAKDKIILGIERKGVVLSAEDRRTVAYHEVGHAILAKLLPFSDPIHKITIIPRGRSMGVTQQMPGDEYHAYSKEYLVNRIKILLGGRAAEELVFGRQTTAAKDDLLKATEIATLMVCQYGMSEGFGLMAYPMEAGSFLGVVHRPSFLSEEIAAMAESEIQHLISSAYKEAKEILAKERSLLTKVAEILLIQETLDGEEFDIIYACDRKLAGKSLDIPDKCAMCNITWCEKKIAGKVTE